MNRATIGGLACGLALLLTTACSGKASDTLPTDGPFGSTIHNSGMICAHTRPGGVAYSGFEDFPNKGGIATISQVKLAHSKNLRLVDAWVILTPNPGVGVGVGGGYPTARSVESDSPGLRWNLRQRIPGATVRHTHGKESINLVIVAKPIGKIGTSTAVDVYYKAIGRHSTDGRQSSASEYVPFLGGAGGRG